MFHKDLKEHMEHAPDNARCTSPKTHNEIISLCEEAIRERIMSSIPKYWSLIADETQDCSTTEQVSICTRYISSVGDTCEDFMGFIKIKKMDAQSIADALLSTIQQ